MSCNNNIVLSPAYLGNIEYYSKIANNDIILIEQCANYIKQTYRNRCCIASPNGALDLIIPIIKPNGGKCLYKDILLDNDSSWQQTHLRAIETAYNSSPFLEYYIDGLLPFYTKKFKFLTELNEGLQTTICDLIGINTNIVNTAEYLDYTPSVDFRDKISPKKQSSDSTFITKEYYQVFKSKYGFLPNLSIIDLLFNMGSESILYLK